MPTSVAGRVGFVIAMACIVGCRSVRMDCFFSGLLALISLVGCRAGLMACFCILSKISMSGASQEVISLFDLNYASPWPDTICGCGLANYGVCDLLLVCIVHSSPVVRW